MVLLILSILAIVAAPRFLSVQDEAMKQARKEMVMNMNAALNMGAVKAALEGKVSGSIEVDGEKVCIKNGYPTISKLKSARNCYNLFYLLSPLSDKLVLTEYTCNKKTEKLGLEGNDIYFKKPWPAGRNRCNDFEFKLRLAGDNCWIKITESKLTSKPLVTEGCIQP